MRIIDALPAFAPPDKGSPWASNIASLDEVLGGGLGYGQVHEIYAAEPDDASSTAGFAMATAMGMCARADRPKQTVLWLRERRWCKSAGILQANGWAELGGAP